MLTEPRRPGWPSRIAVAATLLATVCASGACASLGSKRLTPRVVPASQPAASGLGSTTIESNDAHLAAALLRVRLDRTAANLVNVGYHYYDLGIRDAALGAFMASLSLDPAYAPALDGAARIWRDWGQVAYALGSAHRATYFAPQSAEAWNTLGTVLQALELEVEAGAAYRKALSLDSSAAYARNNLCQLAFRRGNRAEAVSECALALDISSDFLPAVNNLALIYASDGNSAQTLASFSTVHRASIALYNMGIVNLAQRDYSAAVTAFEAAYHAEPTLNRAYARAREARRLAARPEALNGNPSR